MNTSEKIFSEIRNYANELISDVKRGRETPQLAARSIRNYGYGLAKATEILLDTRSAAMIIFETDRLADELDDS